ncbi:hypothetical protein [Sinorhizobium meliloti]|uniref:hypothetical protein n=1 Tax=Rhizobium meliloti TaxID=382 RepID=UPI003F144FA1
MLLPDRVAGEVDGLCAGLLEHYAAHLAQDFADLGISGELFRVACARGLEGIIAKHVEKPYRSGRGEWWQKITCKRRDSFVVVDFEPSTVPGHSAGCWWPRAKKERWFMSADAARAGQMSFRAS